MLLKVVTEDPKVWSNWSHKYRSEGSGIPKVYIVRADGKQIRTVTVKIRYTDMDEHQGQMSLPELLYLAMRVHPVSKACAKSSGVSYATPEIT